MAARRLTTRLLALTGCSAGLLLGFFLLVRPWYLRWGTTPEEARRPLPGDGIVSGQATQLTRAVTVNAPAEEVWPWLAQLGQDRGGFYSFDLLENLAGCEMPTTDRLRSYRQSWEVGDKLWMYPERKAGGLGFATLRELVPGRALAFGTHALGTPPGEPEDASWAFVLEPLDPWTTRLLVRARGSAARSLAGRAFDHAIFEPVHFTMERRMMIGLKQLAERSPRPRLANHLQVALWIATFSLFVAAAVRVMRRRLWLRPLMAFVAAGVAFQVLTLGQPTLLVGLLLVLAVGALSW